MVCSKHRAGACLCLRPAGVFTEHLLCPTCAVRLCRDTGQDTKSLALGGTRLAPSSNEEVNAGGPQGTVSAKAPGQERSCRVRGGHRGQASAWGEAEDRSARQCGKSAGRAGFSLGAVGTTGGSRLSPG